MRYIMLDTCIWWNLSTDYKERAILIALKDLVDKGEVRLIISDIVRDEINKNREAIKNRLAQTYRTYSEHSKTLAKIFEVKNEEYSNVLTEIDKLIENIPEEIKTNLAMIDTLFADDGTIHLTVSDDIKFKVVQRGLNKVAPFHRSKNSVADAVIAEEFKMATQTLFQSGASWAAFVTDNKSDFSDPNNPKAPHPDLSDCFSYDQRISYSINIAEVLNSIRKDSLPNEIVQHVNRHPGYRELFCELGGNHHLIDAGWFPSPFGGRTWHKRCEKCGLLFDTGDMMDD
jgi:hypothetical protein